MSYCTCQKPLPEPHANPHATSAVNSESISDTSSTSSNAGLAVTGKRNFIESLRSFAQRSYNQSWTDDELVLCITKNWDAIARAAKKGQFTKLDLEQMKEFVSEKKSQFFKPSHNSIETWLDMLDRLLSACHAFNRIDRLLFSLSLTKPGRFSQASQLFATFGKLPRVPRPGWVGPLTQAGKDNGADRNLTYIHLRHAFVYNSRGIALCPDEVVHILARDVNGFVQIQKNGRLNEERTLRLRRLVTGYREFQAERGAWRDERNRRAANKAEEMVQKSDNNATESGSESSFVFETGPPSFMAVSEAYHFVSKLVEFYGPYTGSAFDEAQILFRDLRRELQRELADSLVKTDFSKYFS